MALKGKKIAVLGLGISGKAALRFALSQGAKVTASQQGEMNETLRKELQSSDVEIVDWAALSSMADEFSFAVVSPGIPPKTMREVSLRCPIVSDIELASQFLRGTIIGITGTNGKSTVTSMVGNMVEMDRRACFVGGNLGVPLCDGISSSANTVAGVFVVELSSFQLHYTQQFRPHVAALISLAPDHLDWHEGYQGYVNAKMKIFGNQGTNDHAVISSQQQVVGALPNNLSAQFHYFGNDGEVRIEGDQICDLGTGFSFPLRDLKIQGLHNQSNACAAVLIARLAGVSPSAISEGLKSFSGLPHRMELVAKHNHVVYYNDSKATNVDAALTSVVGAGAIANKTVVILGGKDKGASYAPLRNALQKNARAIVLIGAAADKIEQDLGILSLPVKRSTDMNDAVRHCAALAKPGDAVLLAPACSSFDMFRSFEERGNRFRDAVLRLADGGGVHG